MVDCKDSLGISSWESVFYFKIFNNFRTKCKKAFAKDIITTTTNQAIFYFGTEIASVEDSTPFVIAALALQLMANEEDNRQVSKVAKEIVFSGGFSNINKRLFPVEKALFLLDLLEVGRRKYTQLHQILLPDNIVFPSYSKLADLRDIVISRPSISVVPK